MKCECGSKLFWRNYKTGGWWKQLVEVVDGAVEVVDTDVDGVKTGPEPRTMQCCECKRRVPNPSFNP